MTPNAAPFAEHPVAAYLRDAGITKAAIIDDAYDPPTRSEFAHEIDDFWGVVVRTPALVEKIRELKPGVAGAMDVDDDLLRKLWERRNTLPELRQILDEQLFPTRLASLAPLELLGANLQEVGVTPICLGSQQELPEPIKLVFLDYRLGPGMEPAVEAARAKARRMYDAAANDADKPFIVLMSSHPEASAAKDRFREASGLLGGLFGYTPKDQLKEKERLYLQLATWALGMPARHQIQHFVEALEVALDAASKEFRRSIRSLGFEDYANIQWLSLQAEGHPFGHYMLWLYKSFLAHLLHVHEKVVAEQRKLDALCFQEFSPSQSPPSMDLAKLYRFAITEPVDSELTHPRAAKDDPTPLVRIGDLFFKEESADVLIVINPACDLAYAPKADREFPKDRPILLLHGVLQALEDVNEVKGLQTDLFHYEGKNFRVLWDHRRVTSNAYGEVSEWLRAQRYSRKARLALPYALQVQQEFAMHLMRIGTPVRPPIYAHADVAVFCKGDGGKWLPAGERIRGAAVIIQLPAQRKDGDQFVLTVDCIGQIVDRLDTAITLLKEQKGQLNAKLTEAKNPGADPKVHVEIKVMQGKLQGIDRNLEKLRQLKELRWWLPMTRTPNPLPARGKFTEVDKLLRIYHATLFEDGDTTGPSIRLNIASATGPEQRLVPGPAAEAIAKVQTSKEQSSV